MSMSSLKITEFKDRIPFLKSITFRFDGLNNLVIKSYRSDEINDPSVTVKYPTVLKRGNFRAKI